VLDIGCGTGGNLAAIAARYPAATLRGIDVSTACVDACRSRGIEASIGDASSLLYADGSIGLVTILDALEHIEDESGTLREIARVLAPDGVVLVTVPAYSWLYGPHDQLNQHVRRYTRPRLVAAIRAAGLRVEQATYFNTLLFPVAATARLLEKVSGRHAGEDRLPAAPVNAVLRAIFSAERWPIGAGIPLPFGLSVLAVGRRAST
jgi:ubiquinone/menaquinone biosynthesis C-methylase UbiE